MKSKKYSFLYIIIFLLVIFSCDSSHVYEKNFEIPNKKWDKNNIVKFKVAVTDTINLHNVYVNLRNTSSYPYCNLFLFITIKSPIGESVTDTFECTLADERGKWLGRGFSRIWDYQILYKKNVCFPVSGEYTFEYIQAMRRDILPEITDVGLKIEKSN